MKSTPGPRVIVVGAGMAGIAATERFVEAGWQVMLLDKADKPGGRCATRSLPEACDGGWFDYGAHYFTARDPAFRAALAADRRAGVLCAWQPRIGLAEQTETGWQMSASPDERERLIGVNGLNPWLAGRLARTGVHATCNTRVKSLVRGPDGWQVHCHDEATARIADALVVTVPAPQAADLLGDAARSIPALAQADTALAPCQSLIVETPGALQFHGLFVKGGALAWCADNSHKAQRDRERPHFWTLHAGPAYSQAHLEDDPTCVQAALIAEFAAITGLATTDVRPVHRHRWRYARPGDGAPAADTGCVADPQQRWALAGDWLAGGRIEGAWRSGRQAAHALIAAGCAD
ncbi:FAD-dependent oxidoreductase [Salinisphaera sp. T31B1]|uniref:NAD(P)/FAD-dependent oxidoreductase n=1 Tax=Salinisphaera sp. T31B1 TaxID=727963 RepID=UPI0033407C53